MNKLLFFLRLGFVLVLFLPLMSRFRAEAQGVPQSLTTRTAKQCLGRETIAILSSATHVEVFQLGNLSQPAGTVMARLEGYPIIAMGKEQNAAFASKLAAALLNDRLYRTSGSLCFSPHVGFRAWSGSRYVDVLICFHCSNIQICRLGRQAVGASVFGFRHPIFVDLAKEALPNDGGMMLDERLLGYSLFKHSSHAPLRLGTASHADINLVPYQPATAPNYFCTWSAQNYMYGQGLASIDPAVLEGGSGSNLAWQSLTEDVVFGPKGWANEFYPRVRKDLYFLLDDGYYDADAASMELNARKFPSFTGDPAEKLGAVRRKLEAAGWRGLGLWTRHTPSAADRIEPLLRRSFVAGVKYWKIDGGDGDFSVQALKLKDDPALILEHVSGEGPFNGDWTKDGRFGPQPWGSRRLNILKGTDVFRTYDVSTLLSVPTTLDRVAELLGGAQGHPEVTGLINCEDEVYLGATLGCTLGVMRHPLVGLRPSGDPDVFFAGPRQAKRRMDEVVRALHWQRIAEPYGAGQGYVKLDGASLTDDWVFRRGETWDTEVIGKDVRQGAPARVARNLPLPTVTADGDPPFVIAGRFPNGAVAVCALERTVQDKAWYMPLADVSVDTAGAEGPFGIFGHYRTLTLDLKRPLAGRHVFAQDLAGEKATDVTRRVRIHGSTLTVPGSLIDEIGRRDGMPTDLSDPGMVLAIVNRQ